MARRSDCPWRNTTVASFVTTWRFAVVVVVLVAYLAPKRRLRTPRRIPRRWRMVQPLDFAWFVLPLATWPVILRQAVCSCCFSFFATIVVPWLEQSSLPPKHPWIIWDCCWNNDLNDSWSCVWFWVKLVVLVAMVTLKKEATAAVARIVAMLLVQCLAKTNPPWKCRCRRRRRGSTITSFVAVRAIRVATWRVAD